MLRKSFVITLVLAGALAVPSTVGAIWSAHGAFEPDYPADVTQGFMYPLADHDSNPAVKKVYFNAFLTPGYWSGVNPNVGATQSRILTAGLQAPMAFLGVWKDCNKDNYIGMAESAVTEYRSELLLDKSVCPDGSSDFNRNGWVYEFLWIMDGANIRGANYTIPRFINDTEAYVWGDPGRPGDAGAISCYINPQTGTFSSTGAMIAFADCNGNRGFVDCYNAVIVGGKCVERQPVDFAGVDPENRHKLAFTNREFPQCSDSRLNIALNLVDDDPRCPNTADNAGLLQQHSGHESVTVWDCSRVQHHAVASPVDGSTLAEVYIPSVRTSPTVRADGSLWDAANHTVRGVQHGQCEDGGDAKQTRLGALYDVINPEMKVASGVPAQRKTTFYFENTGNWATTRGQRNGYSCATPPGGEQTCVGPATGHFETPQFLGVGYPNAVLGFLGPMWMSNTARGGTAPTVRDDGNPQGPVYYTFYARVSSQTTSTGAQTPGGTGIYGSEICQGNTVDIIKNFDCNPNNWWREDMGSSDMPTSVFSKRPLGQKPGASYNLRDIDCYDGSVAAYVAPGVGVGLTPFADPSTGVAPCANY